MELIAARLGLQQRVLPLYRRPFFEALAGVCQAGLGVFAGEPRRSEAIETSPMLEAARLTCGRNLHLLGGSFYLCWQAGLLRWLDDWQPDVLIVEANPRYLRTPAAIGWMKERRRPVIGWGLGAPPSKAPLAGLRAALRRRFLGRFDALITYSRQGAAEYRAAGFAAERIFTAPNAVAPRPPQPPPRPPGYAQGRATVLFVGRLQGRKRVDLLLRACAALPAARQPIVWICGDGPERHDLEALAAQTYPQAKFFGACYGAELEKLFGAADLFVLPGTGGLAIQQAMSYGLPVMAAEADGTQSDLVRPENGWRLPPGDLQGLVAALDDALSDARRLRQMGGVSYRIVAEEINLENMVSAFQQAVSAVMER